MIFEVLNLVSGERNFKMKMVVAVLLLFSIGSAMGLKCYLCTYGASFVVNSDACGDPFDANGVNVISSNCSDIDPSYDVCATTSSNIGGTKVVVRSCFLSTLCPSPDGCFSANNATVCCCNSDNCNDDGTMTETGTGTVAGTDAGITPDNGAGIAAVNIIATVAFVIAAVLFTL